MKAKRRSSRDVAALNHDYVRTQCSRTHTSAAAFDLFTEISSHGTSISSIAIPYNGELNRLEER